MSNTSSIAVGHFKNLVGLKFQLYNSLFTSLPFHRIEKTGILLTLLLAHCEEGFKKNENTTAIIENFFNSHTSLAGAPERAELLFRFVQYAERQVVLFDALEDAAFRQIHDMSGSGTLKQLDTELEQTGKYEQLNKKLEDFRVRLVLTAHPTQFYPGSVLAIINDLSKALADNNAEAINMYLQQLGKTAFVNKIKPTPYEEAVSLIWYLENVFYKAAGNINQFMKAQFPEVNYAGEPLINMGFWPGGDRDGNPFVKVDTTLRVADALRSSVIKCYYRDVRKIRRRLTFAGVEEPLTLLEKKIYKNISRPGFRSDITVDEMLKVLQSIRETINTRHDGLFVYMVEDLISKIKNFGLYFASIDIRQDSHVHTQVLENISEKTGCLPAGYNSLSKTEKIKALAAINPYSNDTELHGIEKDTIDTNKAIKKIQQYNGEAGCNRYIISHTNDALNVLEVYALFILAGWDKNAVHVDIIPLFETVEDLQNAAVIMKELYENDIYKKHLARRGNKQTIMVGFSDGTKDGGYLMANWSIYKAKEALTTLAREYKIDVLFFDGRGGPPARGGGKTHQFYASMGNNISGKQIQLTLQGQTVSSKYGTIDSAQYNMEQLIHAGISNQLADVNVITMSKKDEELIQELANCGYKQYTTLKNHPAFVDYLVQVSPLRFYSDTNIGSRPAKRGNSSGISLSDLRAIPFVGSWSQIKQNITGYYGVGSALQELDKQGRFDELKKLYKSSLFFKTMLDNCEMSMLKCFFPLTAYLASHPKYREIWRMIKNEFELTEKYILKLSGHATLMSNYPVNQLSIQMRERIVLPLLSIQQYAISKIRDAEEAGEENPLKEIYGKLAMRCSFGIINAGRNSA